MYLFGVMDPGFFGLIDVDTKRSILFMPRLPEEYAVWMGKLHSPADYKARYAVDEVYYVDEVSGFTHLQLRFDTISLQMKDVITKIAPSEIHVMVRKSPISNHRYRPISIPPFFVIVRHQLRQWSRIKGCLVRRNRSIHCQYEDPSPDYLRVPRY